MTQRYTKSQIRNAPAWLAGGGAVVGAGLTLAFLKIFDFTGLGSFAAPFAIIMGGSVVLLNAFSALKLQNNSRG
jgi:hypothetical protein